MSDYLPTTAQTIWHSPSMTERVTWDEARLLVREHLAAYSSMQIPSSEIDAAIRRSVQRAYPHSFMDVTFQGIIDAGYPDQVALGWPAEQLIFFGINGAHPWLPQDTAYLQLGTGFVDLSGGRIRFLMDSAQWPFQAATEVTFTARVLTKPQLSTVSEEFCTLPPDTLVQLAEHELWPFFARSEGMNQTAITAQQRLNWQTLRELLPRRRVPSHKRINGMQTVSSTVFASWGQPDVRFGDLS